MEKGSMCAGMRAHTVTHARAHTQTHACPPPTHTHTHTHPQAIEMLMLHEGDVERAVMSFLQQ